MILPETDMNSLIAVGIYAVDVGTLSQAMGYSAIGFLVLVALVSLFGYHATPA